MTDVSQTTPGFKNVRSPSRKPGGAKRDRDVARGRHPSEDRGRRGGGGRRRRPLCVRPSAPLERPRAGRFAVLDRLWSKARRCDRQRRRLQRLRTARQHVGLDYGRRFAASLEKPRKSAALDASLFALPGEAQKLAPILRAGETIPTSPPRPSLTRHPLRSPAIPAPGRVVFDTGACIGCNASVVACQPEKNVASIRPEEIPDGVRHALAQDRLLRPRASAESAAGLPACALHAMRDGALRARLPGRGPPCMTWHPCMTMRASTCRSMIAAWAPGSANATAPTKCSGSTSSATRTGRNSAISATRLGVAFLVIKGFEYHDDLRRHLFPGADFALAQNAAQAITVAPLPRNGLRTT